MQHDICTPLGQTVKTPSDQAAGMICEDILTAFDAARPDLTRRFPDFGSRTLDAAIAGALLRSAAIKFAGQHPELASDLYECMHEAIVQLNRNELGDWSLPWVLLGGGRGRPYHKPEMPGGQRRAAFINQHLPRQSGNLINETAI
jgi:hypothetical protein